MATITKGVGIATFYGTNTFLDLEGSANNDGSREFDFDAIVTTKKEFEIEIAQLAENLEVGESFEAVGGWLNGSTNYRTTYEIICRPFVYTDPLYNDFDTYKSDFKELLRYKYKYLKVREYLYTVNPNVISPADVLLYPICIESIEFASSPNVQEITLTIKHALSNNG